MVKKIISLIIMITITMMMTSHVFAQDTVFIDDNFEASSTENWIDNTGRGIKSVEGDIWNKHIKIHLFIISKHEIYILREYYTVNLI